MAPISPRLTFFSNELSALLPLSFTVPHRSTVIVQINEAQVHWDSLFEALESFAERIDNLVFLGPDAVDPMSEFSHDPFLAFVGVKGLCVDVAFSIVDWGVWNSVEFLACSFYYDFYEQFRFQNTTHVCSLVWKDMSDNEWPAMALFLSMISMNQLHWSSHAITEISYLFGQVNVRQMYVRDGEDDPMGVINATLQLLERTELDTVFVDDSLSGILVSEARYLLRGRADVFRLE